MDIQITNQTRLQLCSKYIGCTFINNTTKEINILSGINYDKECVINEYNKPIDVSNITLFLSDVNNISDFDCISLSSINLGELMNNAPEEHLINFSKTNLNIYLNGGIGFTKQWESLSYLVLKHYAVPFIFMQNDLVTCISPKQMVRLGLITLK